VAINSGAVNADDEARIRAGLERYVAAALDQDWDRFIDVFDPAPLCMPAGVPALRSHEAIRDFYSQFPALDSLALTPESLEAAGDLVVETGAYAFSAGDARDRGKYLHLWRRQPDGSWKLYKNIANSDGSFG
jgi:ketosteroid isomerase-like protein